MISDPELSLGETVKRPPIRYHGSKFTLAPWIISLFPEHRVYCEAFGGGASVLLRKPRSVVEVYNDLDGDVVNLFRILRDPASAAALERLLWYTPFARDEFLANRDPSADPLESARRMVSRSYMGFGTHSHNPVNSNGFRFTPTKAVAQEFANFPACLQSVVDRLRGVLIENREATRVILAQDSPETLHYVDPPYLQSTRESGGKGYACEMSEGEHAKLAFVLRSLKGKVVISGYPSGFYEQLYKGWRREEKEHYAGGQAGRIPRTEVLWLNF